MQTKYIAAGVLVILSCSPSVLSSTSCYGRSENVSDGLATLESDRTEVISEWVDASILFFEPLNKLVVGHIYHLDPKTPEKNAVVNKTEALRMYKKGFDHILSSILFALGECCDGIDTARDAIYAYLNDAVKVAAHGIALVMSGDCSENQAAIDLIEARVQKDGAGVVREIYKLFYTCLNTTDTDALAAIETAENGSVAGIRGAINALANAMKFVAVAVTSENKSQTLLYDVEGYQAQALAGLREKVYHEYALAGALYVSSCSNQTGFVSKLAVIQYKTISKLDNGVIIDTYIFDVIINRMNRILCAFSNDGDEVSSPIDVVEAKVANEINDGINYILDSISSIYSVDTCAIADIRKATLDRAKSSAAVYFSMIGVALDQSKPYLTIITEININKNKAIFSFVSAIQNYISIIPKIRTCNNEIENNVEAIFDRAINYTVEYVLGIRDAVVILAKIAHANGTVCRDPISAIQEAQNRSASALANYINTVPEALRLVLLASNQSSP